MKWEKKGLIYKPSGKSYWDKHYGILPTPHLVDEQRIRIYFASTDEHLFGRISYIEVSASNPSELITEPVDPIIVPGVPGTFDDCGCNPSCVIAVGSQLYLYYSGFQRSYRIPYTIFTGLAVSGDKGQTFVKHRTTPILERTDEELTIRSAPTIIHVDGKYFMWYVSASGWIKMDSGLFKDRLMPRYIIKKVESANGVDWTTVSKPAIQYESDFEFGFGRPYVIYDKLFKMWYSIRRIDRSYRIGYAESQDGIHWVRKDNEVGIDVSETGWDSEMICYPAVIKVKDRTYLFYNGNNNGETGFGWAELVAE